MPLTVRVLRDQPNSRLLLGCGCPSGGWQRYVDLASAPAELLDRTIADLHASGRWTCPRCGRRPAAMVYALDGGMVRQVERWADDER